MTPANRGKRYPSEALSAPEIQAILEACGSHPTGRRNRAAITLMYRGGLRCAEALSVRLCDFMIDEGRATVRVLRPKGASRGKPPRIVGLGKRSVEVISAWVEVRPTSSAVAPLCCTRAGKLAPTSYFRELLPRLALKTGIERRVHPHALRHSFAFEAVMEGLPLPWISKALGHTSLLTTMAYLDHVAPADVISGMQERD